MNSSRLSWVLAMALSSLMSKAHATMVHCSPSGTGCFHAEMPLLNQNDPAFTDLFENGDPSKSVLCVPTSATMALGTITASANQAKSNSWSAQTFSPLAQTERVRAMAKLMGTDSKNGTSLGIEQYPLRSFDFSGFKMIHDQSWYRTIDDTLIQKRVEGSAVTILNYGHYEESCSTSLGGTLNLCIYKRQGGHELAVNGTLVDDSGVPNQRVTRIYDPWYARINTISFQEVPNRSTLTLFGKTIDIPTRPYLGNTRALAIHGSSVKIVDRLDSLETH